MKSLLAWLFFCGVVLTASAQVQGSLRDSLGGAISYAVVSLWSLPDSQNIAAVATDTNGVFGMSDVRAGRYLLMAQLVGFRPLRQEITVLPRQRDLGIFVMKTDEKLLSTLVVEASVVPVTIKNDTVEFNAAAYKTADGAVAEDLFRRLPGVEVDKDGNVTAMGKGVTRILVDGKPFFGDDPQAATKNIPADAIDKVKVFERRSEQSVFTGFNDGSGETTIDIRLKPDRRKGQFGKVNAGFGTDNRFMGGANFNRFKTGNQMSVLVSANNTNQANFTYRELMDAGAADLSSGGGGRRWGGGGNNGIATTYSGGINFAKDVTPTLNLSGNYLYNVRQTDLIQSTVTQSFLNDGTLLNTSDVVAFTNNNNHRGRLDTEWKPDTTNTVTLKMSGSWSDRVFEQTKNKTSEKVANNALLNSGLTTQNSQAKSPEGNVNAVWQHRFAKPRRTFSADLNGSRNSNLTLLNSYSQWLNSAINGGLSNYDQQSDRNSITNNATTRIAYTEPINKRYTAEIVYSYNISQTISDRQTYDLDTVTLGYTALNDGLSNDFVTNWGTNRAGLTLRRSNSKYDIQAGAIWQYSTLLNTSSEAETALTRSYQRVLPNVTFNTTLPNKATIRARLDARMRNPTVQQLQPVVENADPQNLYLGNPNLQPSTDYNLNANYSYFNKETSRNSNIGGNFSYLDGAIIEAITQGTFGSQTIQPVNVRNGLSGSIYGSLGIPLKGNSLQLKLGANANASRSLAIVNTVEGQSVFGGINPNIGLNYNYKEALTSEASFAVGYIFSQNTALNQPAQNIFNYSANGSAQWKMPKDWQLETDINYRHFDASISSSALDITLWNVGVSKGFLKDKTGRIKLQMLDILNQNSSIDRTSGATFITESRTTILKRYALLSVTWRFGTSMQRPGTPPDGPPRGEGGGGRREGRMKD